MFFFPEIIYSALTPLESRKSIAACVGSKVLSPGRKLGIPAPRDARRLSPSPEARRIKVPAKEKNKPTITIDCTSE